MIVIYDTLGSYGGSHTLMLRMGEWANQNNIKMTIIATSINNVEIVDKLRRENVNVICANLSNGKKGKRVFLKLMKTDSLKVFCFTWNNYLDVERIKKKYNYSFDNYVYCIHFASFKKGEAFKTKFLKKYLVYTYRKIFERMLKNNAVISLDELIFDEIEKYLIPCVCKKPDIIRLPMHCIERNDKEEIIKKGFNSSMILTAARADFPFKGYMIGLIDLFTNLKAFFPELCLEIVSSGDDIQMLEDKINEQKEEIKKDIKLNCWMPYEKLKAKMSECKLFVGMGTTIFDAALQYKPVVVVRYNTLECLGDYLVEEIPQYTAAPNNCVQSSEKTINRVLSWDYNKYYEHCDNSFDKVKNMYDINSRMKDLLSIETKTKGSILSWHECVMHMVNQKLNKIRINKKMSGNIKNEVMKGFKPTHSV